MLFTLASFLLWGSDQGDQGHSAAFYSWYYTFENVGAVAGMAVCPLLREHVSFAVAFATVVASQVHKG